jgi:short-subunit dehydrogenase
MRRQLAGGVAIVTGASSGIGRELAAQLAAEGVSVLATARREPRLQALVRDIRNAGGTAICLAGDVADPRHRQALVDLALSEFRRLDFLINNAGVGAMGRFESASPERLRQLMEVNFFAPAELMRLAIEPLSRSDRALIVNMGSVLGHRAVGLKSEYCASKFALHGLSDAVRAELAQRNIDLLLVHPSTTASEFFEAAIEDTSGVDRWATRRAALPAVVARKTIAAMKRGAHEIILSPGGKLLVWLDRLLPEVANRLVARDARRRA